MSAEQKKLEENKKADQEKGGLGVPEIKTPNFGGESDGSYVS